MSDFPNIRKDVLDKACVEIINHFWQVVDNHKLSMEETLSILSSLFTSISELIEKGAGFNKEDNAQ